MRVVKERNFCLQTWLLVTILLGMGFVLSACLQVGTKSANQMVAKQDGIASRIKQGDLDQGLSVIYLFDKYRHVNDMPQSEKGIAKYGRPGPPIKKLDHRFGDGKVLESGRSQEIGILMNGYMHLEKDGEYLFQAKSNDGFQLFIDGNLVVSDPGVHGDRLSDPGLFKVNQGGMFPVEIKYFQRKGTATLELYWQPPGTKSFTIVPSFVYGHLKK